VLPQAFVVSDELQAELLKRESIIINSLLKQVSGVGPPTIRKFFAGGMNTLQSFYKANITDVAVIGGIKSEMAAEVLNQFRIYQAYQQQFIGSTQTYRERLDMLCTELRQQQELFRQATLGDWYANNGMESEEKKQARRQRQQVMWKINMTLAEEGSDESLNLIQDLRQLVFERRLDRLEDFLKTMKD
jgi:hypothetical protein